MGEQTRRRWRLVRAGRWPAGPRPGSVRRFAQRARRRRLRMAVPWLIASAVLASAGVGTALVYGTSVFGVARVRIVGTHLVTAEEVRAAAKVPPGTPLARLDGAAIARRVEELAPVRRAVVQRSWPRTLVIGVTERVPVAVVPVDGGFELLDRVGVIFGATSDRPADLPLLRVGAQAGDGPTIRAGLTVLAALTPVLRASLAALVADAPTRIRLELTDGRLVIWGDAEDNAAKVRVATSFLTAGAATGTTIDVSAPSMVTVR